jgi:mono/diheme cytochrome c family protein
MKRYVAVFVIAIIVAFALSVLLSSPALAGKGDAAAGKAVYTKKCATCHGAAGEGKDAIAKMMKVELKHLGSKEVQAKTDADLTKVVTAGSGKMKPVAGISPKEMDDLMAFVRSLAK